MTSTVSSAALRKSVRTSVILPRDAHTRIQVLAETSNDSAAWIIRAAALRLLEEQGDETQFLLKLPKAKKVTGP